MRGRGALSGVSSFPQNFRQTISIMNYGARTGEPIANGSGGEAHHHTAHPRAQHPPAPGPPHFRGRACPAARRRAAQASGAAAKLAPPAELPHRRRDRPRQGRREPRPRLRLERARLERGRRGSCYCSRAPGRARGRTCLFPCTSGSWAFGSARGRTAPIVTVGRRVRFYNNIWRVCGRSQSHIAIL